MSKNYENSTFKDLLDKLQQESWQLELLISGFAIFGLFSAIDPITIKWEIAEHENKIAETLIWFAANICCWILIINLMIHVVLRGLWIGALGLRYISDDIDYDALNYSPKFTKYLKNKIGSFDKYIGTLEDYCSIVFAVSFLFVFYFLASLAYIVLLLIIVLVFLDNNYTDSVSSFLEITGITLIIFILLGMFLTFLDFITQGFLKRKKWTSTIYYPLYRVFSLVTFSFLYRPLVYNFLDNKFGKRLSFILIPIYILIGYLFSFEYMDSNYLKRNKNSSSLYANYGNYEDMILKENDFIDKATIQSKVITDNYLKVFVVLNSTLENRIFAYNKGLEPEIDERGLSSSVTFNEDYNSAKIKKKDSLTKEYYKTFNTIHKTYINKTKLYPEYIASSSKNKKLGFETYINIDTLPIGKHIFKINRTYINRRKDTIETVLVRIPFWKFKK